MMIKLHTATRWPPAARPTWPLVLPLFLATMLAASCANGPDARSRDSPPNNSGSPDWPAESSSSTATPTTGTSTPPPGVGEVPIKITIGDTVITARLADNATAHDLAAQLPLELTFRDFNQVEKVSKLPRPLSMDGAPTGDDPDIGDLGYYAPSGDLVFYYGDVGYWNGIVRIGRFDTTMEVIGHQDDGFQVTIERA